MHVCFLVVYQTLLWPQALLALLALLVAMSGHGSDASLLVADTYAGRLMELRGDAPTCTLFDDRDEVRP